MSIRIRLVLTISICLILAFGGISFLVFSSAKQTADKSFHTLALNQAERVEEWINTFLSPGAMSVHYLATLPLVRDSRGKLTSYLHTTETTTLHYANHPDHEQRIYDEFIRVVRSNDDYGLVFMANDDGQYAQAPEGHSKQAGYDPRMHSWYKEVMQSSKNVTVSAPYLTTGGVVCSVMVKTQDLQGKPLGMLGVAYNLDRLTDDLTTRRILQTGYLVVFAPDGRIIVDGRHPEHLFVSPEDYPPERKRMAAAPSGILHNEGTHGLNEFIVIRTIDKVGWKIAVVFRQSEMLESSYALLSTILLIAGIMFAITLVVLCILARSIAHPLEKLIEASVIISSGAYENSDEARAKLLSALAVKSRGESAQLAEALKTMINTLHKRIEAANVASHAKSSFLSTMSHEIRTPMNAIIGMTTIGKNAEDVTRKNYAFDKIKHASTHLLGIINDVLDMSKIEANKLELSSVEFDFEKMIQNVITVINFRIEEKRQRLSLKIGDNTPKFIIGDEQRLAQVILNLLSNAVKFTPEQGEVSIDVSLLEETGGVCELRVAVADNGVGISPSQQNNLFEMFVQVESGTNRAHGGTGLGLAISKRILALMDGRIWVESDIGKGARFIFTIKALRGQQVLRCGNESYMESAQSEVSGEAGVFDGKRLLLAEDVEINREIFISLLEGTGLIIDSVENGKEALDVLKVAYDTYDIVFMDVQMPIMDGLEATRQIRVLSALHEKKLPIIAMTANVFKSDIEKCIAAGMDDHLGKPINIVAVLEKLRQYL